MAPRARRIPTLAGLAALAIPAAQAADSYRVTDSSFNPAVSVILDGRYSAYSEDPETYKLPGFPLAGEAGLADEGLSAGESELVISGNVDDLFYAKLTASLANRDGESEVALEEAYVETVGLGHGLDVRAGRFYSRIGYLNEQHPHVWDFADAPLAYWAMLGEQYSDDGVQLRWLAPSDLYVEFGAEALRGGSYPAGGAENDGVGAGSVFLRLGGDVGASNAWLFSLSHLRADAAGREAGGDEALPQFDGNVALSIASFVWKWAPDGNPATQNFKLQAEYLYREEDGDVTIPDTSPVTSSYDGTQSGLYVQGVYQFMPNWRVGLRYDWLQADNTGSAPVVLAEAGLDDEGHDPQRYSVMVDYSRSEYARLRLQYNRDEARPDTADDQVILQYVMSLGAHGAHRF